MLKLKNNIYNFFKMIPFASISFLSMSLTAFICLALLWRKNGASLFSEEPLRNLFYAYLTSGLFFLVESVPSLLTKNGLIIQAFLIVSDSLIPILTVFLFRIFFYFSFKEKLSKYIRTIFVVFVAFSTFYLVYNFLHLKPSVSYKTKNFIFWLESANPILLYLHGLMLALALLFLIFLYVKKGWNHKNPMVRKRSRLMAASHILFLIASGFVYYGQVVVVNTLPHLENSIAPAIVLSTLLGNGAFLLILRASLLRNKREATKRNETITSA